MVSSLALLVSIPLSETSSSAGIIRISQLNPAGMPCFQCHCRHWTRIASLIKNSIVLVNVTEDIVRAGIEPVSQIKTMKPILQEKLRATLYPRLTKTQERPSTEEFTC
jgi:hypothetical protein